MYTFRPYYTFNIRAEIKIYVIYVWRECLLNIMHIIQLILTEMRLDISINPNTICTVHLTSRIFFLKQTYFIQHNRQYRSADVYSAYTIHVMYRFGFRFTNLIETPNCITVNVTYIQEQIVLYCKEVGNTEAQGR